jgi:hypothetical protein
MWLLWRTRNTVQKFCWNHIYDHRANIQHVPGLRVHSAQIQPVFLKKMMFTVGQIHRHKTTKITVHTALSHLQGGQKGKNNSEVLPINYSFTPLSVFMLYFTETVTLLVVETKNHIITDARTVLTKDLLPSLM